jgi:hypothetical protein|tara:strand:- start:73 stop:354 length:282 start_codon:yes stop_codon:yes gene_type:complete
MAEEKSTDEIAEIYSSAGDSVTVINADASYSAFTTRTGSTDTEAEWKAYIKRNTDHLEIIKAYKKVDGTTSIWTTESFTDIDAAITKGKLLYS